MPPAQPPSAQLWQQAMALAGHGTLMHRGAQPQWADAVLARQLGCDLATLYARPFHALDHPPSAERLRAQGMACLTGENPAPIQITVTPPDAAPRSVEVRASRVEDDDGPCALHVFVDIPPLRAPDHALGALFDDIVDDLPIATFIIDSAHRVTHWNRACERISGVPAARLLGTCEHWSAFFDAPRPLMADLILDQADGDTDLMNHYYGNRWRRSTHTPDAVEAEGYYPKLGQSGCWIYFLAAPLRDPQGRTIAVIETVQDITERKRAEDALARTNQDLEAQVAARTTQLAEANNRLANDIAQRQQAEAELLKRYAELTELNCQLHDAQEQLVQSEKLASIGQLAAGVAHEINNPIGYVLSNITSLRSYMDDLFRLFDAFETLETSRPADDPARRAITRLKQEVDFAFLKADLPALLRESEEGASRVRKIVADLKDFSRVDQAQEWVWADITAGIESTLNVVNNELKYKAEVVRDFAELPAIQCMPSQLNQVFMNLLVNAAHAIAERGTITITTGQPDPEHIQVSIHDTGCGIPEAIKARLFEPFFTTKPVGKGTGLGLSLSYGIVQQHRGRIDIDSPPGKGTTFHVILPVRQTATETTAPADPSSPQ
ncbi:ATP-binding protein [Denitromonas iodatirespirans]|uniref:histidine kinase n=1 Tax=Denitromonas iodatirespirans TaxID=2795389 RepID=A0A944D9I5_DENI1|nr:ATP-binding protein [Denitromonas iodatirespirans]MBT0960891.1 PAS domain-containing protein [Denitromonas iodatirespirans]